METTKHTLAKRCSIFPSKSIPLTALLSAALLAPSAFAQAVPTTTAGAAMSALSATNNVIVTATRSPAPLQDILAQVDVITRDDITNSGAGTFTELLQRRANLDIRATGGPGQPSSVFIRGTNATHTLVLINGQRIASSTSGASALENLPLDVIDRIEVVRGPLSGLYGSDAIGGVIQIFTRPTSTEPRLNAAIGVGTNASTHLSANIGGTIGATRVSLDLAQRRIDAPSASNPAAGSFTFNPDRDPYENTSVALCLVHQLWQGETVSLNLWSSTGKTNFDAGLNNNAVNKQHLSGLALVSENNFTDSWKSRLSFGSTRDDSRVTTASSSRFETTQKQLSWQHDLITQIGNATIGIERRREEVASSTRYTANERVTDAIWASLSQRVDAQTLTLTARRDREDQFGKRSTGNATWGYQLWKDELIYLSAGKAFRAPSFNDLYFPGFSNPLLRPEKSESGEFGWRVTRPSFLFNFALFENRIDELIVFDSATSKPQNIRRARIRGWEAGLDTRWLGLDWRARLTAQQPEDTDTNKQLRGRARLLGSLGVSYKLGAWEWGADVTGSGARFDSTNEAPTSRMAGYALLGGYARYRINGQWSVDLTGSNLLDRRYELARGYNPLGRQLQFNVRFSGF
jgi:vitamin B12 transporter